MKRTKVDMSEERLVLSHCIADSAFLREIHSIGSPALFESKFARTVAGWVWEFHEETGLQEAPGRLIQEIYQRRKREVADEDELDLVQEFLVALSADWERAEISNAEWSIQQGIGYFKMRSLEKLEEGLKRALTLRDTESAEQVLADYKRIQRSTGQRVSMIHDTSLIEHAFNNTDEVLFEFPGALGQVIGPILKGDFGAFFAPMKRGKSYWLKYFNYCAMRNGLETLSINLEMTLPQVIRRDWQMICCSPKVPGIIKVPYFTEHGSIDWEDRQMLAVPTSTATIERAHKALRYTCRGGNIRTEILPSKSTTISDIRKLIRWYRTVQGVDLKALSVDYADLLIPENNHLEGRAASDYIWAALRGLAQEESITLFTASQTNRLSLERDARESDAAEDVRKLAHVTKAVMLNQSDLERKAGIMRVRCSMQREEGSPDSEAVVLEQRAIGRCCLDSRLRSQVDHELIGKWKQTKDED